MLSLLLAGILIPKVNTQSIIDESWARSLVVGHRGAAAYATENTLPAFTEGIKAKAAAVECDVHMSKDGVPMIMHDSTVDRTFPGIKGKVADLQSADLIAAGVPTLEALIRHVKGKAVLIIEIKGGIGVEKAVVDMVAKEKTEAETIVFSFNADYIKEVKRLNPKLFGVWLSSGGFDRTTFPKMEEKLKEISADAIGFQFKNVNDSLASHLRYRKIPLFVWTVPPNDEVKRLKNLNVNFIITDAPRDIREILDRS